MRQLWTRTCLDVIRRAPREHLDILLRDAGYALRLFRRRPGMTASALLTLAVGVGLNAAVFSVVYGVLWRDLPLPDSERLVHVAEISPPPALDATDVSPANFLDWRAQTQTLDGLATIGWTPVRILQPSGAEEVEGAVVSADFFRIVRPRLAVGRLLAPADYAPLHAQIDAQDPNQPRPALQVGSVVIGYDLWQRQFGGRRDVVGQFVPLGIQGRAEIVGVLEKGVIFPLTPKAEAWVPDVPNETMRRARYRTVVGRLAPGAKLEDAQAEFDVIASRLAAAYPEANKDRGARVTLLRTQVAADVDTQLRFFGATAVCVLLIVCANVSNLLLTHTSGRRRELATRVALGASRGHLVRQSVTEGLVLAIAGGLIGLLLAVWALPFLLAMAPGALPRLHEITVGWPVLAFAAVTSIVVGLLSGAGASLAARRSNLETPLRTTGTSGAAQGRRFRQSLIVGEVALALMLAVAAGLLVQTMRAVATLPLGFDPANVISVGLSVDSRKMDSASARARFESELITAVRATPGVVAAGIGSRPLGGGGVSNLFRRPEDTVTTRISADAVGPGYLEAVGARLVAGRFLDSGDDGKAPKVAVVNEAAERQFFPQGAVGRTLLQERDSIQIVGVLADVRRGPLEEEPLAAIYLPGAQTHWISTNNMLVRTAGDPREMLPAIRTIVRNIDPELPLTRVQTLEERLSEETAPRRFTLWLVSLFSIIALGLAVIGIYGVISESVAQRVPEIGVRMALGATSGGVMAMVLRQGAWLIGIGVTLGAAAAWTLNGVMEAFVFRVRTTEPLAFALACGVLVTAGLLACTIPARRAARIDPVIALRAE